MSGVLVSGHAADKKPFCCPDRPVNPGAAAPCGQTTPIIDTPCGPFLQREDTLSRALRDVMRHGSLRSALNTIEQCIRRLD